MALWTNREKNSQQQEKEDVRPEQMELSRLEEMQKEYRYQPILQDYLQRQVKERRKREIYQNSIVSCTG